MNLELLLAYADDNACPILDRGLPLESAAAGAEGEEGKIANFLVRDGDPDDLTQQRWAIIAPEGAEGDRLLDLVAPLRKKREEDQGEPVSVYRVTDDVDTDEKAMRWKKRYYLEGDTPEEYLPLYVLILGDIDRVSLRLQQALSSNLNIGRLVCPTDAGYAAYVEKVLRWEREPSLETQAQALFFTARDQTAATTIGYNALVAPSIEICNGKKQKGILQAKEILEIGYEGASEAKEAFLEQLAKPEPSMLFTMSHGLGAPRTGWKSVAEQHALQGAMSMGSGVKLTAEEITSQHFLPGGIWFFLACYGGGTPAESEYKHWLTRLRDVGGFGGRVESVLASLPKPGDRPFIAALPQAALANPNGPLALMVHVDLAWTYSFQDMGPDGGNRTRRFEGLFASLTKGKRSGNAYHNLLHWLNEANLELTQILNDEEKRAQDGKNVADEPARVMKRANLWMNRNDLAGYILLGDPATRLPLTRGKAAKKAEPASAEVRSAPVEKPAEPAAAEPAPVPTEAGTVSFGAPEPPAPAAPKRDAVAMEKMEKAVHDSIAGELSDKKIAEREGITRDELRKWTDAYCAAGREALKKLA